jgi:peptidoglycan hydrolase CwlO-like protein
MELNFFNTMTNDTMTEKILNNFKSIKELIKSQEGLQKKVKRMTEGIDSLRKENYNLKRELRTLKSMMSIDSEED